MRIWRLEAKYHVTRCRTPLCGLPTSAPQLPAPAGLQRERAELHRKGSGCNYPELPVAPQRLHLPDLQPHTCGKYLREITEQARFISRAAGAAGAFACQSARSASVKPPKDISG